MEATTWGTSKSWTGHFTAPASSNTNVAQRPVFTERPRTVSKCSTTSSKSAKTKTRPRARGVVYELEPVPVDPNIDPDWDLCFNCWRPDHSHKECRYPKYFDYCRNCGRRGVNWTTCPRCATGYIRYQRWRVENNRPEYRGWRERPVVLKKGVENNSKDDKVSLGMFVPLDESKAKEVKPLMSIPVHASPLGNESKSIQKDLLLDKSFPALGNTKQPVLSPPTRNSAREMNEQISPPKPNGKLYSFTIRDMVLENDHANQLIQSGKQSKSNSLEESLISSEEGDYNEDDEDLDGIIFDDEETNLPEQSMSSSTTQDFIALIDLVKHLSIETQNKVVEDFLQQSRVIMDKK